MRPEAAAIGSRVVNALPSVKWSEIRVNDQQLWGVIVSMCGKVDAPTFL